MRRILAAVAGAFILVLLLAFAFVVRAGFALDDRISRCDDQSDRSYIWNPIEREQACRR